VNSFAARMIGAPKENIVGAECHKFICPAERGKCPFTDLHQTIDNSERALLTDAGERREIIKTITTIQLGGRPHLLESFIDITERKQAEQALRQSKHFLDTLLNAMPLPVYYKDREGRYLGFNKAFEAFFGATKDLLIGKSLFDISPPELAKIYHAKDTELYESNGIQQYEARVKNAQGLLREVIFNKAVFTDSQGDVSGLIGAILDITDRRRAEEQQRQALLYARSLIEADMDPLMTINVEGIIMDVNKAAIQMTGVPRELMTGSDFSRYFTEPDRALSGYKEAFEKGFVRDYPLTMKHASGALTEVLYNASVYRNEKGEMAGVLAVVRDISERLRAEQAEEEARRDGLTGLYNHRTFHTLLKDEMSRTQRFNHQLSLLMLDIDYFKQVNDTYGHQAGDTILKKISKLLVEQARAIDRVCRYGGEEITLILPETVTPLAMKIAERLRAAVKLQSFDISDGKTIDISVSIGVATYPLQADSPEALVKAADLALYAAKQAGRNRVCCYDTEMGA
jgi:diguanylate cyclase (GGDEF)-like protein/PAS domain S-box-containing protein